jgi:RNA polymerase sigma-70 factor (sigma-E family)
MRDDDFRDFVRARGTALSRTAYLLTGDHHPAEDLLQTALARTYQHWPRVRDGDPEAYVRRALHNTYVSWWRRQPPPPVAEISPTTTDSTDATLRRITVLNALRALTPRQRAVIVLRYFEDLTEVQAAEVLGVTLGTVKRLHFDALARLRSLAPHLIDAEVTVP